MTGRLRSLRDDDQGFSLVELSAALILSSMVVGALISLFMAFSQNVGDGTGRADHQAAVRSVMSTMVVELRQATVADPNGYAIESLRADRLAFATRPMDGGDPIRVVYERTNCVGGECDLVVSRYAVQSYSAGRYTFHSLPFMSEVALTRVLDDEPVFLGWAWRGEPLSKVSIAQCGTSPGCTMPLVGVVIRSIPRAATEGAGAVLEISEEVRLRNG